MKKYKKSEHNKVNERGLGTDTVHVTTQDGGARGIQTQKFVKPNQLVSAPF